MSFFFFFSPGGEDPPAGHGDCPRDDREHGGRVQWEDLQPGGNQGIVHACVFIAYFNQQVILTGPNTSKIAKQFLIFKISHL